MRCWSTLLAVAAFVPTLLLSNGAVACDFSADQSPSRTVACITSFHAAVATLTFAPADIYFALERRWLTPEWAWTQFVLGGLVTMGGGFATIGVAAADNDNTERPWEDIGWAAGMIFVGGFYGSVGYFSIENYHPPPTLPQVSLMPVDGGAIVTAAFY